MPVLTHQVLLAVIILVSAGTVAAVCLMAVSVLFPLSGRLGGNRSREEGDRRCRYCHFGHARLSEESAHVEGDDLVEVRCFVCRSCGLPQWNVQRSPVLRRAA